MAESEAVSEAMRVLEPLVPGSVVTSAALHQPSFSFLHHVILTVCNQTEFANGLFSEDEKDIQNLSTSPQQAQFLDKAVRVVSIVKGAALPVQVSHLLAGKQAYNTCHFLIALVSSATDHTVDRVLAVERTLRSELPDPDNLPRLTGPARLIIMVQAATSLKSRKWISKMSPYVELWVTSTRFGEKQRTKVHPNAGRRAIFRQTFHFDIAQPHKEFLFFSAMARSTMGSDKLVGQADLALGHVSSNMTHKQIILMTDGGDDAGLLHIDVALHPLKDGNGVSLGKHRHPPSQRDSQPTPSAPPSSKNDDTIKIRVHNKDVKIAPRPSAAPPPVDDEVAKLVDMGFDESLSRQGVEKFKTAEEALQWVIQNDASTEKSAAPQGTSAFSKTLQEMGFPTALAEEAGSKCDSIDDAIAYCVSRQEVSRKPHSPAERAELERFLNESVDIGEDEYDPDRGLHFSGSRAPPPRTASLEMRESEAAREEADTLSRTLQDQLHLGGDQPEAKKQQHSSKPKSPKSRTKARSRSNSPERTSKYPIMRVLQRTDRAMLFTVEYGEGRLGMELINRPRDLCLEVGGVGKGSQAFLAGIQPGDIIVGLNGQQFALGGMTNREFGQILSGMSRPLEIHYWRTITSTKDNSSIQISAGRDYLVNFVAGPLGMRLERQRGIVVSKVLKGGQADVLGIQIGDVIIGVNSVPVPDDMRVEQFVHGLQKLSRSPAMFVWRPFVDVGPPSPVNRRVSAGVQSMSEPPPAPTRRGIDRSISESGPRSNSNGRAKEHLLNMGFTEDAVDLALRLTGNNLEEALSMLVDQKIPASPTRNSKGPVYSPSPSAPPGGNTPGMTRLESHRSIPAGDMAKMADKRGIVKGTQTTAACDFSVCFDESRLGLTIRRAVDGRLVIQKVSFASAYRGVRAGDVVTGLNNAPLPFGLDAQILSEMIRTSPRPMVINLWRTSLSSAEKDVGVIYGPGDLGLHLLPISGRWRVKDVERQSAAKGVQMGDLVIGINHIPVDATSDLAMIIRETPRPFILNLAVPSDRDLTTMAPRQGAAIPPPPGAPSKGRGGRARSRSVPKGPKERTSSNKQQPPATGKRSSSNKPSSTRAASKPMSPSGRKRVGSPKSGGGGFFGRAPRTASQNSTAANQRPPVPSRASYSEDFRPSSDRRRMI